MISIFRLSIPVLMGVLFATTSLQAWDDCNPCCNNNRLYIGGFGGGLYSNSSKIDQFGTAFFSELDSIGPLAINAHGRAKKTSTGFGGVQLGYEWTNSQYNNGCCDWAISPAVELEAFWFNHSRKGHLVNDSNTLDEHDFHDSFKVDSGVYVANLVFTLKHSCLWGFSPYIGGGIGATRLSFKNADSLQTSPDEPGVNHFNGQNHDSTWTFAGQAKVGLRYDFCESFHVFGEYRYLYVDTSHALFGSTNYPDHVPTSPWNVKVHNIQYNAFVFGLQYDL